VNPILERGHRRLPYLAAAVALTAILTGLLAVPGAFSPGEAAAIAVPMAAVFVLLAGSARYTCRAAPLAGGRVPRAVATHAAGAAVTSAVWVLAGAAVVRLLAAFWPEGGLPARYAAQVPVLFFAGVLLYLVSAAIHYVLLAFEAARQAERQAMELQILAREAELKALKAQIHPHFLFNSLNSISALVGSDPPRAREMCVFLSEFLRKSLAVGEKKSISVGEELSLAKAYLDVEGLRFGARLSVEENLDESGGPCLVPPLLLQPLVENAVRHGIATRVEGGVIRLEARRMGSRLRIVIENPCDPDEPPRRGSGLGLANVRQRLSARYGAEALFAARRLADSFLVVLSVPAELAE
jgi:signal transduction histidine kinase